MKDINAVLSELTLEEKASLCSGKDFWHLKGIGRLDIPSIMVTDGPHGLRKQAEAGDHIGLANSVKATCFPTASATASSWDVDLMYEIGQALGEECLQEEVAVLLGPGANIKRSPLCGRNFEYISEDPYHTGKIGAALVNGIQSKGIGTSLKHFAVNNQEYRRMATESVVDERALREIYLAGFETVVKEAQPWTVMCAYNKVDGIYCSDNKKLLTDILKEEWGHTGLVVTDWGACSDRVEGIKAGMELEMPSSNGVNDKKIVEAINNGQLKMEELDKAVIRVLDLISKSEDSHRQGYKYDVQAHDALARRAAANSAVLLKNEAQILPLDQGEKVAVLGSFAKTPRYQGAGSSLINPIKITSATDALDALKVPYKYHKGYDVATDVVDQGIIDEAVQVASACEVVLIFAGLTDDYESEGFDRKHLSMPTNHLALIEAVTQVNKNVVVVLQNGAPVEMPWESDVKGILECYLGGQAGGPGAVDVLYGLVNPSGKLAETFPNNLADDIASLDYGKNKKTAEYRESIYVGYRYYDTASKEVLYPFGYGLSYTTFKYDGLKVSNDRIKDTDTLTVQLDVTNTGDVAGAEVVQLYVKDVESTIFKADKELKGFAKVYLEPNETKQVTIELNKRAFAYYNITIADWHVEEGSYQILVGASSRDIRLSEEVFVESTQKDVVVTDTSKTTPEYYDIDLLHHVCDQSFKTLIGREIPQANPLPGEKFTINSTLEDVSAKWIGKMLYKAILGQFNKMAGGDGTDEKTLRMMEAIVKDMPLRSMVLMGGGKTTFKMADSLLLMLNENFFKGLIHLIKK